MRRTCVALLDDPTPEALITWFTNASTATGVVLDALLNAVGTSRPHRLSDLRAFQFAVNDTPADALVDIWTADFVTDMAHDAFASLAEAGGREFDTSSFKRVSALLFRAVIYLRLVHSTRSVDVMDA
jgi:hypothetical protein